MTKTRTRSKASPRLFSLAAAAGLLAAGGCAQLGAVGGLVAQAVPKHVDAAYKGLAGKRVLVMVWMDRGIRADYPNLRRDIAASLQDKLISIEKDEDPDALHGATFPVETAVVDKVQDSHPEFENQPIEETAKLFKGVDRLIYVEVTQFGTRTESSIDLFRGTMTANVKVLEMSAPGDDARPEEVTVKTAFLQNDIRVEPKDTTPKEGLPIGTDHSVGQQTVNDFVAELAKRFYKHYEDQD